MGGLVCLQGLDHFQVNRSVGLQFYRVLKSCIVDIQPCVCVRACVCSCVRTPGSDHSLGQADWGGIPNPSCFPQISLGFPAALRSHSVIQNSLTRISGLGQTARQIRGGSTRQTPQKRNLTLSSKFSLSLSHTHTCTHTTSLVHTWLFLPHTYAMNVRKERLPRITAAQCVGLRVHRRAITMGHFLNLNPTPLCFVCPYDALLFLCRHSVCSISCTSVRSALLCCDDVMFKWNKVKGLLVVSCYACAASDLHPAGWKWGRVVVSCPFGGGWGAPVCLCTSGRGSHFRL